MRGVAEHQAAVRALVLPAAENLGVDELPLSGSAFASAPADYRNRILAEDVHAAIDLPPFDNSQMDGYAVRSADLSAASATESVRLDVSGTIAAGDAIGELEAGQAAPIMTGAPIPAGADAVIPIERATPARFLTDADAATVQFTEPVGAGTFLRTRGSDIRAGTLLLAAGTRLGPAQWGTLASSGCRTVRVRSRLRVLLISTGHELRGSGQGLEPGQIFDANSVMLASALQGAGASVRTAIVPDDADALFALLQQQAPDADLIVTTGGVSAGAFEVVRTALEGRGVEFVSVAMQPGGPQGLGHAGTIPVVCFPGNPVSALVSFEMFLRPVLRRLAGFAEPDRHAEQLLLADAIDSLREKHQVRRGTLNDDGKVELVGGSGSHLLHSYATSNLLVHVPVGISHADADTPVEIWRIDE